MADVSNPSETSAITERDFVLTIIRLYRSYPELWKVKTKDYLKKGKRSVAFKNMLSVLKKYKPDYCEDKLKKKINILRTNFNKEFQKLEKRRRSGASSDDMVPSLWYYNDLNFIKDQKGLGKTESSEKTVAEEPHIPSATPPPPKKRKKPQNSAPTEQIVGLAASYLKMPENEVDIVAKGWAMKLGRLAPDQKLFAEKIINDTLFEAEMGTLTRNGVCFLTSSSSTSPVPSVSPEPERKFQPELSSSPAP